jgi:hypothetical protein
MGDTQDILSVAESYEPGQGGIDGGGWKIMRKDPKGYLYQVFESEKIGYAANRPHQTMPCPSRQQSLRTLSASPGPLHLLA